VAAGEHHRSLEATAALLLDAAALTLAHTPPLAPLAYTLTGLALAPVFPTSPM